MVKEPWTGKWVVVWCGTSFVASTDVDWKPLSETACLFDVKDDAIEFLQECCWVPSGCSMSVRQLQ